MRLRLGWRRILASMMLASLATAGWVAALPLVGRFWALVFAFWGHHIGFTGDVTLVPQGWSNYVHFVLPTFGVGAGAAGGMGWWITTAITVSTFATTFLLSDEALPWIYLVRGFCLLQGTAQVYFALEAARFPHDLPTYTVSMLMFSCILIGLVPILYGFTFYLLDFSLTKKIVLTLLTMAHLTIFVPHQYILQMYLIHASVLFMPLLYFVFGPFLDILAFVGFYSWGMSWQPSEPRNI